MKSLRSNRSAIVYVWAVCFLAIVVYSIYWFVGGFVAITIIDAVTDAYNFTGAAASTIDVILAVLYWHPLFFIFGMLIWAYVNSTKKEHLTYYD